MCHQVQTEIGKQNFLEESGTFVTIDYASSSMMKDLEDLTYYVGDYTQ